MANGIDIYGNYILPAATGVKNAAVSLFKSDDAPGDYSSRKASLARQQKLADMLSQMGAQEQAVSTVGGITAPVSPMGALARGLTSFGGAYLSGKAAADEAALKKAGSEELARAVARFGKPYKTVDEAAPDVVEPGGEPVQQYIMKTPDSGEMLAEASRIMASDLPGGEAIGAKLFSDVQERDKPTWRQPGDQLFTPQGVAVGSAVPVEPKIKHMPDGLGGYYEFKIVGGKVNATHHAADDAFSGAGQKTTKTINGITYTQDENGDWETDG